MQVNKKRPIGHNNLFKDKSIMILDLNLRQKSHHLFIFLISCFLFATCIEEYNPNISESSDLLVVDGSIVKGDSVQTIIITRSNPVNESNYHPVDGCAVWATNGDGKEFTFLEYKTGEYQAVIPEEYLVFNSEFKISINTPDGNEYESDYETINESSAIDSLYYLIESYQSSSISSTNGLQFYTDLKASNTATKNYRWILEETWEIHTAHPMRGIWNDGVVLLDPPFDSLSVCYKTKTASNIFTASTENLLYNEKKKIPLLYIADTDYKINYNYSALVKQYALTNRAYEYWNKNKIATTESGGLYQTQPSMSVSNICNINDQDEVVLGFFWASSYTEHRINYEGPLNGFHAIHNCGETEIINTAEEPFEPPFDPTYLVNNGTEESPDWMWYANSICFDCTIADGTITKPDFFE